MRIFTDKIESDKYVLTGDAHRHVAYAQRSKAGEAITLCPQDGYDYYGRIESVTKDRTVVRIEDKRENLSEPRINVTVYSALLSKSDKMDLIAQKLTELGVSRIQPVITKFVQARAESVRKERLNKICEEAAKQCGRGKIPVFNSPVSFNQMLSELEKYDLIVFPYEREDKFTLKELLKSFDGKEINGVAVIIGSEGGFAEEEAAALADAGVKAVTLGRRILRAETANLAVVSALFYQLDEWTR